MTGYCPYSYPHGVGITQVEIASPAEVRQGMYATTRVCSLSVLWFCGFAVCVLLYAGFVLFFFGSAI